MKAAPLAALACALICGCATSPLATTGSPPMPRTDADRKTLAQLRVSYGNTEYDNIKLEEAVQFYRDLTGVNIHVNWAALNQIDVRRDTPVSIVMTDVTVHAGLTATLRGIRGAKGLTYALADGIIIIAPPDDAAAMAGRIATAPKVADTPRDRKAAERLGGRVEDFIVHDIELTDCLQYLRAVSGLSIYADWGALARVGVERDTLLNATFSDATVHQNLVAALDSAGGAQDITYAVADGVVIVAPPAEAAALAWRVRHPTTFPDPPPPQRDGIIYSDSDRILGLELDGIELKDCLALLRDVSGQNIHVNWHSLNAAGVTKSSPVTVVVEGVSIPTALTLILDSASQHVGQLDYDVVENIIVVAESRRLPSITGFLRLPVHVADNSHVSTAAYVGGQQVAREINFDDIELKDIVQFLRDVSNVGITVDWNALAAVGINRNTEVSFSLRDISLHDALRVALIEAGGANPPQVDFLIRGGRVVISTPAKLQDIEDEVAQKGSRP